MTDSTDVTGFTDTANCIPRRSTAVHGGNTATCVELKTRSDKEARGFLSLLSGLCLEFFVRVKRVPTV
jgi:hypothetical protein